MHNPFADTLKFLAGATSDYNPTGALHYPLVVLYVLILAGSVAIARRNWSTDPFQRTPKHVAIWLMRVVMGGLWFQGSLWKIPLPVSDAFTFWTGALAKYTSLPLHAAIVNHVFLPGIALIQPLVFATEISFAIALSLGLCVRLASLVVVLFTAHLWLGLYNDPTEWPWTYAAIIAAHGMFITSEAGRSLGLDNLLRRSPPGWVVRQAQLSRAFWLST